MECFDCKAVCEHERFLVIIRDCIYRKYPHLYKAIKKFYINRKKVKKWTRKNFYQ